MTSNQDRFNRPELSKSTMNFGFALNIEPESLTPRSVVCAQDSKFATQSTSKEELSDAYYQVSSFNLPAQCDQTLITPVSLTSSPSLSTKTPTLVSRSEPSSLKREPVTPLFSCDDNMSPINRQMKYKDQYLSTLDSAFPSSPMCQNPYYGIFGVSAGPQQGRPLNSSPNSQHTPLYPSSTVSHGSQYSAPSRHHPSVSLYRGATQPPILITSSSRLQNGTTVGGSRHKSLGSSVSGRSSPGSRLSPTYPEVLRSSSPKRRGKVGSGLSLNFYKNIINSSDLTEEEKLLLKLRVEGNLPWKEIMRKFNDTMNNGKKLRVATLQMRNCRLVKRLKAKAQMDACQNEQNRVSWSGMGPAPTMQSTYDSHDSWSKDESSYIHDYDMMSRNNRRASSSSLSLDQASWSDGGSSTVQTLNDDDHNTVRSAFSPRSMEEARSRTASDASPHQIHQQEEHKHEHIFEQQQYHEFQQPSWEGGI